MNKDNDNAYCYMAECYLHMNKPDDAFLNYQKALKINRKNVNAWYGSGTILWTKKNFKEANKHINKALKLNNKESDYWSVSAKINHDLKLYKKAENAFSMAISINPGNADNWISLVEMKNEMDLKDEAINILRKAHKTIPDNADIDYRLAACLLKNKRSRSAMIFIRKALTLDFDSYFKLFEYYPEASNNITVKRIIKEYKSNKL